MVVSQPMQKPIAEEDGEEELDRDGTVSSPVGTSPGDDDSPLSGGPPGAKVMRKAKTGFAEEKKEKERQKDMKRRQSVAAVYSRGNKRRASATNFQDLIEAGGLTFAPNWAQKEHMLQCVELVEGHELDDLAATITRYCQAHDRPIMEGEPVGESESERGGVTPAGVGTPA